MINSETGVTMLRQGLGKVCLLVAGMGLWALVYAVPGLNPDGSLDKETVSDLYFEGEFDQVKAALEQFRKNAPEAPDEDKIFVYKYLSVVYASNPETKEKAESYMYQLLKLVPTVDLLDMYISDSIEMIFNKVKARYSRLNPPSEGEEKKGQGPGPVVSGPEETKPEKQDAPRHKESRKWIWWTAGGTAVAAAVTAFILFSGEEEQPSVRQLKDIDL